MKTIKNLATILFLVLGINQVSSQEHYADYYSKFVQSNFEIEIHSENLEKYDLFINLFSMDELSEKGGIILTQNNHSEFLKQLKLAKEKYIEWKSVASANGVKDFQKEMTYSLIAETYFYYLKEWYFQKITTIYFEFKTLDDGRNILIMRTTKLKDDLNKYITHDGFVLVFESESEINSFINKITIEKVNAHISKPKTSALFKD